MEPACLSGRFIYEWRTGKYRITELCRDFKVS